MKTFLKQVFSVFFGILLFVVFCILLVVTYLYLFGNSSKSVPNKGYIVMNLNYDIPELTGNVSPSLLDRDKIEKLGLNDIIKGIKTAADDNRITGILLNGGNCQSGLATIQSIRRQLVDFQRKGKNIYTYADSYSQSGYYLCSVADSLFLNPNGQVILKGFGMSSPYYKDGIDEYDIDVNVSYRGKYKSATEKYRKDGPSKENRYQITEYLSDIKETIFEEIALSRNLTPSEIDSIAQRYLSRNARSAKNLGLIDSIHYHRGYRMFVRGVTDLDKDDAYDKRLISMKGYLDQISLQTATDKIAVVYAEGPIAYKDKALGTIANTRYQSIWNTVIKNKEVKGVVLRINSGGGSAFESDVIWQQIRRIRAADKFVTLSMGDYCASGGYYIGCAADTILAQNVSLTGSIGAYSMQFNFDHFLDQHLGVDYETIATHPFVNIRSNVNELSKESKIILQEEIDNVYRKFVNKVSISRDKPREEILEVAQGRVWSGIDAQGAGLVDEIGDLDHAIQLTVDRLGLDKYEIVEYPKIESNYWESFIPQLPRITSSLEDKVLTYMDEFKEHIFFSAHEGDVLVRLPFTIDY